jgi:hypothetical protein
VQEGLFEKDEARRVMLMRTLDRLNFCLGRDTVSFAAAGRRQRPWNLRRALLHDGVGRAVAGVGQ